MIFYPFFCLAPPFRLSIAWTLCCNVYCRCTTRVPTVSCPFVSDFALKCPSIPLFLFILLLVGYFFQSFVYSPPRLVFRRISVHHLLIRPLSRWTTHLFPLSNKCLRPFSVFATNIFVLLSPHLVLRITSRPAFPFVVCCLENPPIFRLPAPFPWAFVSPFPPFAPCLFFPVRFSNMCAFLPASAGRGVDFPFPLRLAFTSPGLDLLPRLCSSFNLNLTQRSSPAFSLLLETLDSPGFCCLPILDTVFCDIHFRLFPPLCLQRVFFPFAPPCVVEVKHPPGFFALPPLPALVPAPGQKYLFSEFLEGSRFCTFWLSGTHVLSPFCPFVTLFVDVWRGLDLASFELDRPGLSEHILLFPQVLGLVDLS